jgi:hypothetical protein
MSDEGPGAGNVIAGVFLILFGICVTLVGGGCTIMMIYEFTAIATGGGGLLMLLSVITLGGGLALLWLGAKLMSGGFNR